MVLFVDGDFWHGRVLLEKGDAALRATFNTENQNWWAGKISRTVARDHEVTVSLQDSGWAVLRVWERDVLHDIEGTADRLYRLLTYSLPEL